MTTPQATVDVAPATPDVAQREQTEPQVRVVDYCQGSTWALSRTAGVVWVLSGPPSVVADRRAAALRSYRRSGCFLRR